MSLASVNDVTFASTLSKSTTPVLVDFWATWCQPCVTVEPFVEQLAAQYGEKLKVVKCNVESCPKTALAYKVTGLPTFGLFVGGKLMGTVNGANKTLLRQLLSTHVR